MRGILAAMTLAVCAASTLAQTIIAPPASLSTDKALLLAAHPAFRDAEYRQTVIVVAPVPNGGHVGVILNRPTRRSLASLFPDEPASAKVQDRVYYGGPFSRGALIATVKGQNNPGPGSIELMPGVHLAFRAATIDRITEERPQDARFYVGYVAWKPGELTENLERGLWFPIVPPRGEDLFPGNTDVLWQEILLMALMDSVHPEAGSAAASLGGLLHSQGHWSVAEALVLRHLELVERRPDPQPFELLWLSYVLGAVRLSQGNFQEAEQLFKRSLAILDKDPKANPGDLDRILKGFVTLYTRQNRPADAAPYEERLRALSAKSNDAK